MNVTWSPTKQGAQDQELVWNNNLKDLSKSNIFKYL